MKQQEKQKQQQNPRAIVLDYFKINTEKKKKEFNQENRKKK